MEKIEMKFDHGGQIEKHFLSHLTIYKIGNQNWNVEDTILQRQTKWREQCEKSCVHVFFYALSHFCFRKSFNLFEFSCWWKPAIWTLGWNYLSNSILALGCTLGHSLSCMGIGLGLKMKPITTTFSLTHHSA